MTSSNYNPEIHHRRSIRLKGYDYSSQGAYFVTLCVQNRKNLFGSIDNGILNLNEAGNMILKWYRELENKFPALKCEEVIVMPNHFHCIWHITAQDAETNIPTIAQWFKTMTTNEYIHGVKEKGWPPFDKRLWQRNYYEHIIRDEQAYENIRNYIKTNPEHSSTDRPACLSESASKSESSEANEYISGGHAGPPRQRLDEKNK